MADLETKNALVEVGCAYWFNDNEQVRSPFPKEIQPEVKSRAQKEYLMWLDNLTDKDQEEVVPLPEVIKELNQDRVTLQN